MATATAAAARTVVCDKSGMNLLIPNQVQRTAGKAWDRRRADKQHYWLKIYAEQAALRAPPALDN
jgi:hypothetical protein